MKCTILALICVAYYVAQPGSAVRQKTGFNAWPLGQEIKYSIASDLADGAVPNRHHTSNIKRALEIYTANTCLKFREDASSPVLKYVKKADDGCKATKGYQGGSAQIVELGSACDNLRKIWHETAHALSFEHEHTRSDRDTYIEVLTAKIRSSMAGDFQILSASNEETYGMPYDYGSAMHYGPVSFGTVKTDETILSKQSRMKKTMGSEQVSFLDLYMINKLYCDNACSSGGATCNNGGYRNPNDCSKCVCPRGLGGAACDAVGDNGPVPDIYYPGKQFSQKYGSLGTTIQNCQTGPGKVMTATDSWTEFATGEGYPSYDVLAALMKPNLECFFQIKAQDSSKKVQVQLIEWGYHPNANLKAKQRCGASCTYAYLEVKTKNDLRPSGARLCCLNGQTSPAPDPTEKEVLETEGDKAHLILYSESGGAGFKIRYKQV